MAKNLNTVERGEKVRIGKLQPHTQADNTIIVNASETIIQAPHSGFFASPIRQDLVSSTNVLAYNATTNEIVQTAVVASDKTLQHVTDTGNVTTNVVQFTNGFVSSGPVGIAGNTSPMHSLDIGSNIYIDDTSSSGNALYVRGNVYFDGNVTTFGETTFISSKNISITDPILELGQNNVNQNLIYDLGILMKRPGENVGIAYLEASDEVFVGYTENTASERFITSSSNLITMNVVGDVYANAYFGDGRTLTGVAFKAHLEDNVSRIEVLETDADSNALRVSNLEIQMSSNGIRVGNLESNLAANSVRIGNLEYNLQNNSQRISTLYAYHASNVLRIEDLEANVNINVHTRLNNLESNLTDNSNRITTLSTRLEDNSFRISVNTANIANLQVTSSNNFANIATLQAYALSNGIRVSTLETSLQSNALILNDAVSNLAANSARISALEVLPAQLLDNSARISALEVDPEFEGIITGDGGNISNITLQYVSDLGNTTSNTLHLTGGVSLKTDGFVGINVEPQYELHVGGDLQVDGNFNSTYLTLNGDVNNIIGNTSIQGNTTIHGNLVVHGATSYLYSDNVKIQDPIIGIGNNGLADTGIIIAVQNPSNVVFGYDASETEFIVAHSTASVDGTSITPDAGTPIDFRVYGDMYSNTLTTVGDVVVGGNLEVRGNTTFLQVDNLAVDDAVIKIAAGNELTTLDSGVVMQRAVANVAMVYRGDENELMFAYTTDDPAGVDITPDTSKQMNVHVYGSFFADKSINVNSNTFISETGAVTANIYFGDGGLLSNITQTLQGITDIGNTTTQTLHLTNTNEAINAVANIVSLGYYFGNGEFLTGISNVYVTNDIIASNLETARTYITSNVNILNDNIDSNLETARTYITSNVNILNDNIDSNLSTTRDYISSNVNILNDNIASNLETARTYITSNVNILNDNIASNLETARTYMTSNVNILNDNIESNLSTTRDYISSNVNILNDNIASNLETARTYITSNVNILNDNIASNLSTTRDYISSNVNILNNNIESNLETVRTYISSNVNILNDNIDSNVNILNDNIESNLSTTRDYISSNVNILNDNIASNLETARTYIASNVNILNDNIASNLETARTYITSNVNILNDNIDSNLSTTRDYISSNVNILNDNIASNLETARTYITSNVNILNDNIASNLETARTYITSNVNILNDNIASNLETARNYITSNVNILNDNIDSNVNILNDNIDSNLETARTYITSNVNILNDNIASNLSTARDYITSNVNILNDNIASNLETVRTYITSNVNILNDNIDSNLSTTRDYISSNVNILNDNIASNLETARTYITSNVNILNDNIASNLETARTYITSNVNILNDNIASNLETARTYITSNVQILNNYIALKSNILDPHFSSNISVESNVTTSTLAVTTLTAGRVPYVGTDSFLVDHDHLTFTQGAPSLLSVGGDVNVSGNLFVQGTTTFLNTTNTIINDAIVELANNNTSDTLDMGFIMTRPSSNVGVGFRGDEAEFMIGHTLSDPSGADLVPDTGNALAVHVYGSMDVDKDLEVGTTNLYVQTTTGRVGIRTNAPGYPLDVRGAANVSVLTAQGVAVNRLNLTGSNVVDIFGTANATAYYGNGGFLSNVTLQQVTTSGNTTTQVVSLLNTHTALTTNLTSNVGVNIGQLNNVTLTTPLNEDMLVYNGTQWVNQKQNHTFLYAKANVALSKGDVVYASGAVGNNTFLIDKADARDPTKMPAIGVVYQDLAQNGQGLVVAFGRVDGVTLDNFIDGETVYVSNTVPGGLSNVIPVGVYNGAPNLIQNVGIIVNKNAGVVFVTGVGRTNAIPNANVITQTPAYVYTDGSDERNTLHKIAPTNLLTKLQTLQQVTDTDATTTRQVNFTNTHTWSLTASGNIYAASNVTALEYYGDGTKLTGVALKSNFDSNVARIGVLEANVVDLWDNVYSNATTLATLKTDHENNVARIGVLEANVVDLWDNVYSNATTLATLKTDHEDNVVRIGVLEANVVDLWDNVYSNASTLATLKTDHEDNVVRIGVLEANVVDLWDNVYSNASTLATLKTDHENNVVRIGVLEANVVDLWDNVYSNASTLATLKTDHEDNVVRIGVLEANVVDLWDNVYSNASTLATLKTDHEDNVVRIGVLEANVVDLWDNVYSNASTLATLKTDHEDNVVRIGVLEANVVDLWDNVYSNASTLATLKTDHEDNVLIITTLKTDHENNVARLDTAIDDITDLENTRATTLDPTFTSNITVNNVAYVNNGLSVNNTRFYAYSGSMTNPSSTIGLEFASNVFYARVMAQLVYDTEDVNTLVLELQGGKKTGTPSKNITIGTLNKFGDTTKPWSSDVTTSATEVTIKPHDLNQNYDYEIMVEYTSPGTDSRLVAIKEGSTAVKNFPY